MLGPPNVRSRAGKALVLASYVLLVVAVPFVLQPIGAIVAVAMLSVGLGWVLPGWGLVGPWIVASLGFLTGMVGGWDGVSLGENASNEGSGVLSLLFVAAVAALFLEAGVLIGAFFAGISWTYRSD
jgi:hypothetical protein